MANDLVSSERLVGIKAETTYGVDAFAGVAPTEWIAFENFSITPEFTRLTNQEILAVHSTKPDEFVGDSLTIAWTLPITGGDPTGAGEDAPLWAALLGNANFKGTAGATEITYNMVTGNRSFAPSATYVLYMIESGHTLARKWTATGVRGNRTFTFTMNEIAKVSGTDKGLFAPFPAAAVAMPAYPEEYTGNRRPFRVTSAVAKIANKLVDLESLEVSTNWTLNESRSATSPSGALEEVSLYRERGNAPNGSLTIKGRGDVLSDILPNLQNGDVMSFEIVLTRDGRTLTVTMPSIQFGGYSAQEDGRIRFQLPFFAAGKFGAGEHGENELLLVFS